MLCTCGCACACDFGWVSSVKPNLGESIRSVTVVSFVVSLSQLLLLDTIVLAAPKFLTRARGRVETIGPVIPMGELTLDE